MSYLEQVSAQNLRTIDIRGTYPFATEIEVFSRDIYEELSYKKSTQT